MVSTLRFPSTTNVAIPRETGQVIAFIRDKNKFPLNKYIQYMPVDGQRFLWHYLERDRSVRVVNTDEMVWHSGDSRKSRGRDKASRFNITSGLVTRRDESTQVGWIEDEQTHRWSLLATEMESTASVMMTARTKLVWDKLATTALWQGNTAAANTLNGGRGTWDKGSDDPNNSKYNAIQFTLLMAMRNIKLLTNNKVDFNDMQLVINPDDAIKMSLSAEIRHILNQTILAGKLMEGEAIQMYQKWGLPARIAGIELTVEDSPIVTAPPLDSGTEAAIDVDRKFIAPSNTAYLLARPGALDGAPGSPSYSTVQVYHYKGLLEAEAFPDAEDRLTRAHVSEQIDVEIPAPFAGYQITNILS